MIIRRIDPADRGEADAFILRHWFSMEMAIRGERIDLGAADGWAATEDGRLTGLITCRTAGDAMEILSLDSEVPGRGVGTALLNTADWEARRAGCSRVTLITTNDNLPALRFYQKRGFDMAALYRNAAEAARRIKPQIPMTGIDGIPIRHEIELELRLKNGEEQGL